MNRVAGALLIAREEQLSSERLPVVSPSGAEPAEDEDARLLAAWRRTRMATLTRERPAAKLRLTDVSFQLRGSLSKIFEPESADVAIVHERIDDGARCTLDWRELAISWSKGPDPHISVDKEQLIGETCCALDGCEAHTPGDSMVWMQEVCRTDRGEAIRAILPANGIPLATISDEGSHGSPRTRERKKRDQAEDLCGLLVEQVDCAPAFDARGEARCRTFYPGEQWNITTYAEPGGRQTCRRSSVVNASTTRHVAIGAYCQRRRLATR